MGIVRNDMAQIELIKRSVVGIADHQDHQGFPGLKIDSAGLSIRNIKFQPWVHNSWRRDCN